jgi:transglutaminase-like putative cysteine protease
VFFAELKDRIKKLPMKDAVLEVNHWCHEKVTYRGSDGRTSSPLASVRTAWGRCGEESTFTVAALRSVGIPARQCYTPRWAHCDDNHAWVEVWVDGKWHFIGACEPDADLDLAWFTKPAKRAMLVNTTVFGDYEGPEDVLQKEPLYTRINVLENYSPTRQIHAFVKDQQGKAVDSATVEFQLYNYAEFYPLYTTITGNDGHCSFRTGYGDLLVWVAAMGKYGLAKCDVRKTDSVTVILDREAGQSWNMELDLVPPVEAEIAVTVSDSAREANNKRLAFEDGLRKAYEATFTDSAKSYRFARLVNLNPDTLWRFFRKSCGNWRTLTEFISQAPATNRSLIFPLLDNISEKDLRDIDTSVLTDNLLHSSKYPSFSAAPEIYYPYVLSPRVDNEFLKPYKDFFQQSFSPSFADSARNDPRMIAVWLRTNITPDNLSNYGRAPLTPIGVFELRVADNHSADICFVAICRSFGIPARLDPATRVPQYFTPAAWHDVFLFSHRVNEGKKGRITLTNPPANGKKPEYSTHFTIETLTDGFFRTLDYEGSPLVQSFPCTPEVPFGTCMLVTGSRLTNGTVLAKLTVFGVDGKSTPAVAVELRKTPAALPEYGRLDPRLLPEGFGKGMIVAWIEPGKEPTRHLLADLKQLLKEFGNWGGTFTLVVPAEGQLQELRNDDFPSLPANFGLFSANKFPLSMSAVRINGGAPGNLPIVVYINSKGVINYYSAGYRIGTAAELLGIAGK